MPELLPNPEAGRETKEQLAPGQSRTATQIEDIARTLAGRADKVGGYGTLAPLAPEGFSEVLPGGLEKGGKVFVKESGNEPGANNQTTKVRLMKNDVHAEIDTDGQEAVGVVKNTATGTEVVKLSDKEARAVAAEALWDKRNQLRKREKAFDAASKAAARSVLEEKS